MANQAEISKVSASVFDQTSALSSSMMASADSSVEASKRLAAKQIEDENRATLAGQQIANIMGADPSTPNFRLNTLAAERAAAETEAMQATKQLQELGAVSFFDNPLTAIVNAFKMDSVETVMEAANTRAQIASRAIKDINADVATGMETQRAISKRVDEQRTADELELTANAAMQAANELKMKAINTNLTGLQAVQSSNNQMMSAIQHQQSMAMEQQRLALSKAAHQEAVTERLYRREQDAIQNARADRAEVFHRQQFEASQEYKEKTLGIRVEQWDWRKNKADAAAIYKIENDAAKLQAQLSKAASVEEKNRIKSKLDMLKAEAAVAKVEAKKRHDKELVAPYRRAVDQFPSISLELPEDDATAIDFLDRLAKKEPDLYDGLSNIATTNLNGISPNIAALGRVPSDSLATLQKTGIRELPNKMGQAYKVFLADTFNELTLPKGMDEPAISNKTKKEFIPNIINKHVYEKYESALLNPETNPVTRAPSLAEMVAIKKIAAHPITAGFLQQSVQDGVADSSVDYITERLAEGIKSGAFKQQEAADYLAMYYKEAVNYNNADYNYIGLGLPAMKNYPYVLNAGKKGNRANAERLDLTNAAAANRLLTIKLAESAGILDTVGGIANFLMPGAR
jgi:hypothetical protein